MKKTKKTIAAMIILTMMLVTSLQVSAYNYSFTSGADSKTTFAPSTDSDVFTVTNPYENVRNNKDSAYAPPSYGVFSGDIPTDVISPYHEQDKSSVINPTSAINTPSAVYSDYTAGTSGIGNGNSVNVNAPASSDSGILPSTSFYSSTETAHTQPLYYEDGSIGVLEFPSFNKIIKVYEGETTENMRLGAGHFSSTSVWNGNVCAAAHNRGVENNFSFLKDMNKGDTVKYTTQYGVRTYKVEEKRQILTEDVTVLEWASDNRLTLITCVEGVSELRLAVILYEVM